jgi:DNA relaxase NicK
MRTAKQIFAGVDYLRLTAQDHAPFSNWHGLLLSEMLAEERAGRKRHNRWLLGYYGTVGQHFFIGKSEAGCMVQVSGAMADTLFRPLSHAGGRASRVDLQVSRFVEESPDEYLHRAFVYAEAHVKKVGSPPTVLLTDSNSGARMLTIGSRTSELYGRVYDKGQESKQDSWMGYIRWEVEVKGKQAADLHRWLLGDVTRVHTVLPVVRNFFSSRGVPVDWDGWTDVAIPPPARRTRTDETKCAWLSTQVAPTIRELVAKGKALDVARALLQTTAEDATIEALALALAQDDHS